MPFSSFIARRYMRSQRSRFVSFITVIAVLSITVGVMALNTTLAVMNGFRDQLQATFVNTMPMVSVMTHRPSGFADLPDLMSRLETMEGVTGVAPWIRKEALLTHEIFPGSPHDKPTIIWGVDAARQPMVTTVLDSVRPAFTGFDTSDFIGVEPGAAGLILGESLAQGLRAGVGDVVTLTAARPTGGLREFEGYSVDVAVVGIFRSGLYEFDNLFAYMDIDAAASLFQIIGGADGVGLRLSDMMMAPSAADSIADRLGVPYFTNDWISLNSQLFQWIETEKILMFLLLSLITLVASFAVVAILMMMVRDRQRDIGIFMAMGVRKSQLVGIFVQLGLMIGFLGVALGSTLGLGLCVALDRYGFELPGDVYFIELLPVHMKLGDFGLVAAVTLVMCLVATLLPSWLATRFTPVEVLRHE